MIEPVVCPSHSESSQVNIEKEDPTISQFCMLRDDGLCPYIYKDEDVD